MANESPKVEFDLGSEVSPGHFFFKSSFARSFVTNSRDSKSLGYEFVDGNVIKEELEDTTIVLNPVIRRNNNNNNNNRTVSGNSNRNNNNNNNNSNNNNEFFSLVNLRTNNNHDSNRQDHIIDNHLGKTDENNSFSFLWRKEEPSTLTLDSTEFDKLHKQCQTLMEENRRLQNALARSASIQPQVQVVDTVYLQSQVDTLQWQLKQTEANRQMYRSLMEQVVRFLDRTRKSLDILQEKNSSKQKLQSSNINNRVPRSRSVHAVHTDSSPARVTTPSSTSSSSSASSTSSSSSTTSSSSNSSSSRFTRAKSVTQITPATIGSSNNVRDMTWSVLRRNDPVHCTPPRSKPTGLSSAQDLNQTHDGVVYQRPKQVELDPDDIPPEKLSQEAFRLMRTVQSLLATREPDLARVGTDESNLNPDLTPTTTMTATIPTSNARGTAEAAIEVPSFLNSSCLQVREAVPQSELETACMENLTGEFLSGTRRSIDATSLNSTSSKTTEEEDPLSTNSSTVPSNHHRTTDREILFAVSSTPNRKNGGNCQKKKNQRSKAANSISSVEDESGFSSMSSFQEVGLPAPLTISPIKGCHTEVGLPEVPIDKIRHRRWSSTPAEIKALFKRNSASFPVTTQTTESLSVWV